MSGQTVRDYVRSQRRVDVAWEPGREVLGVRIARADGTFRAVAATALELERYGGGPIEIFRFLVRDDSLDQAAIALLAADRIRDLAGRTSPGLLDGYSGNPVQPGVDRVSGGEVDETLTIETLRRAVRNIDAALRSGATSAREAAQAARGFTRALEMAPGQFDPDGHHRRLREMMQEHTRRLEEATFFGGISKKRQEAQVEKPEPLAPPNPDLPFYRMER